MEREQMHFVVVLECAELDTRYHADTKTITRCPRGRNSVDGVVIGEGDGCESAALRSFDHFLGRKNSVGSSGVSMQINECSPRP